MQRGWSYNIDYLVEYRFGLLFAFFFSSLRVVVQSQRLVALLIRLQLGADGGSWVALAETLGNVRRLRGCLHLLHRLLHAKLLNLFLQVIELDEVFRFAFLHAWH